MVRQGLFGMILGLGAVSVVWAVADKAPRTQLQKIQQAYKDGDRKLFERLAAGYRNPVLLPYVEYYRMVLGIDSVKDAAVEDFLARNQGTRIANQMRGEWLRQLAAAERWDVFARHWPPLKSPDDELLCANLRREVAAERARGATVRRMLLGLDEVPAPCRALFADLAGRGLLAADDLWERMRGLPTGRRSQALIETAALLPESERPNADELRTIASHPERYLSAQRAIYASRTSRELALLALVRLAAADPAEAAAQMLRLENQLSLAEQGYAWGHIGFRAAQRHLPEALQWYENTRGAGLSDEQWQWWARAALRAQDWALLRQVIGSMPARVAQQATWVYWLARGYRETGEDSEATALFQRIAGEPHFYGNLASEELGREIALPRAAQVPALQDLTAMAGNPSIRRSLELFNEGLREDAVVEWNWALSGMSDRELLIAAELARREGIYDRAIGTANQTRREHDYSLRYLTPFEEKVRPLARQQNVDEAWVYGLMRQESRFVTEARSPVGASGLMQLMPGTAQWVARRIGMREYRKNRVAEPEINLMLGTSYLRLVMESLDNHPVLASAAYNAGPSRARAWRDAERTLEGAIYIETIPFTETREYVKKVMSNALYYALVFGADWGTLKDRLGVIAPPIQPADGDLP
jgi:soluble lytic murein transglycosylase